MLSPFNSPLELSIRIIFILTEAFPTKLDVNRLVLLDHGLLHSADLGGPESLHPPVPLRVGELGLKRQRILKGLDVLIRAGLAQVDAGDDGINFRASEGASNFVRLLETPYAGALSERAEWVVGQFGRLSDASIRQAMRSVSSHWSEEFEQWEIGPTELADS